MKAIICGGCVDIRALPPTGSAVCRCGNVTGEWVDPVRGTVRVEARNREAVRMLGLHNGFLKYAFFERLDGKPTTDEQWRRAHGLLTGESKGFLFHDDRRGCPFVIFRVGETNDVWWGAGEGA
ncbi:MAG: hypothetical protein M3P49_09985 [Actinomycetota bacterium]|nr:hypothetical protein [Actinomycetota bacterium]